MWYTYSMETPGIGSAAIEAEIAQLTKEIEAKRAELESSRGISHEGGSDRGAVREVLGEKLGLSPAPSPAPAPVDPAQAFATPASTQKKSATVSYLDSLDDATVAIVNSLVQQAFDKGILSSIRVARSESPYVVDAFHDVLTDRVYEELKKRNIVK